MKNNSQMEITLYKQITNNLLMLHTLRYVYIISDIRIGKIKKLIEYDYVFIIIIVRDFIL